jgi:hypothetical protein
MRRANAIGLAALAIVLLAIPATPSFAQASGHVRVSIVKAALLIGGGTAVAC